MKPAPLCLPPAAWWPELYCKKHGMGWLDRRGEEWCLLVKFGLVSRVPSDCLTDWVPCVVMSSIWKWLSAHACEWNQDLLRLQPIIFIDCYLSFLHHQANTSLPYEGLIYTTHKGAEQTIVMHIAPAAVKVTSLFLWGMVYCWPPLNSE